MDYSERPGDEGLVILDYGSQYTLLITRRFREHGIYAEVIDGTSPTPPDNFKVHGVILSGGPDSVKDVEARKLPQWVKDLEVPILGICYGMQLMMEGFGGKVRSHTSREYGKSMLNVDPEIKGPGAAMFAGMPVEQQVWMSHGDDVEQLPEGFHEIGKTTDGVAAAVVHESLPLIGLQFHPEVQHTTHGADMLHAFAFGLCDAPRNWETASMTESVKNHICQRVGDGRVLIGVSGGVDSTVAAVLMSEALGADRVDAVFVDTGLLRLNEGVWVAAKLRELGLNLIVLEEGPRFMAALKGLTDPEEKRKVIGRTFIKCFEEFATSQGDRYSHLGQGTLYPDVIESAGHGAGAKVIKSHHNVGGLPEKLALQLAEPFRFLFKDEVRAIGRELGLSDEFVGRHPFPGPGLAVRLPGEVTQDRVEILQKADSLFIEALREDGLYDQVWQAFAVLLPVKSVGVMGDNRTWQWALSLRAVTASDGMTAGVAPLSMEFLTKVADRIVRGVDGINRVVYDITSKPPATIEWE